MSDKFQSSKRCYLIDQHSPPPPVVTLENLDYAQYEDFFRKTNVDSMMVYCKDHWGYCWYPTKVKGGQVHPGLRSDYVREVSQILRKLGIEFTAYYCFEYDTLAGRGSPAWRVQTAEGGGVVRDDTYAKWPLCCMRTDYRQYCLDQLAEIVREYHPDSLFLDIFGMSLCYCPCCQKEYKKRYGTELPQGEASLRENRRQVLAFLEESERELLREVFDVVKTIDPTLAVTVNFASHYPEDTRKLLDYQFCEPVMGDNWFSAAYTRDTAEGRFPLLMPGEFSSVYNYAPRQRYVAELSEIAAQGCRVGMYSGAQHADGTLEMEEAANVGKAYEVIRDMQPFITGRRPVPYAAILQSDTSKTIGDYGLFQDSILRLKRLEPHTEAVLGAMRLCEHAKIPWRVLTEQAALEHGLAEYPVLLLPEVFILTPGLAEMLARYVADGGLLISAHETAMYDEAGERLNRCALGDLFGIGATFASHHYARNGWGAYLRRVGTAVGGRYAVTTPPVSVAWNSVDLSGAEALLEYVLPAVPVDDEHWVNWWSPPPGPQNGGAALAKQKTGEGTALYAGFDLFRMAAGREYPHLNDLFAVMLQFAKKRPPVWLETKTPDFLYTGFFQRKNKLLVHQIVHPPQYFDGGMPPVPGGTLALAKETPLSTARLVYPVCRELPVSTDGDALRVQLPKVDGNAIVELTLDG